MDKSVQKDGGRPSWWLERPGLWGLQLSSLCLLGSLLSVVAVVVLRYLFREPSIALQDLSLWLHAASFMLAIPAALKWDQHVRVDIFYRRWPEPTQGWVDLIGSLLFLFPLVAFLLYGSWDSVVLSWRLREASAETGGLPGLFIVKSLVVVMPALLAVQGVAFVLSAWRKIRGDHREPRTPSTEL